MHIDFVFPKPLLERCCDYLELCKPRVVLLMMLTAMVGMCLATTHAIPWEIFFFGNLGIAFMAGSAATINHLVDRNIDQLMRRTQHRPIAQGKIAISNALVFSGVLCFFGLWLLIQFVNVLTASLTFLALVGYAVVYTSFLKYRTSQNIVIGGLVGAAPPLLGWVAITNQIDPGALVLALIIFVWTPPHFWALAIDCADEYAKTNVPILPITHDIAYTKLNILLYTILLCAVSVLPFVIRMSGWIYLGTVILLNARFLYLTIRLWRSSNTIGALSVFRYSIMYLMGLFIALLIDHYSVILAQAH